MQGGAVPVFQFGPGKTAPHETFDVWHETARPLFDTAAVGDPHAFRGGAMVARLGDLVLTDVHFTPQCFTRTHRHIAQSDHFQIQLYTHGGVLGSRGNLPFRLAPDRIGLCHGGRPHHAIATQSSAVLGVSVPWDRVDAACLAGQPTLTWPTNSAAGQVLAGALKTLRAQMSAWSAPDAAQAANGLIGLLNGLLGSRRQVDDPVAVRGLCRATIERYIGANLYRPELDAALLCQVFACSRSQLYSLFREHGGVQRYLRNQRLDRCLRDLAGTRSKPGVIKGIAEHWGFHDASHFHRLFRNRFDLRPSDALASGGMREGRHQRGSSRQDVATVHAWFRAL
jgi:AraC-like DNA-binding protein